MREPVDERYLGRKDICPGVYVEAYCRLGSLLGRGLYRGLTECRTYHILDDGSRPGDLQKLEAKSVASMVRAPRG